MCSWRFAMACLGLALTPLALHSQEADRPVKVMTFNLRFATASDGENAWDKRKEFLAETIRAFNPDLLGTQETLASQRDYLSRAFPTHAVFAAGRDDGKDKGEMAALYWNTSRFEKLDGGHFWLSDTPERVGSKGWDSALPRIATWVKLREINSAKKPVLFLNVHLDHQGAKARLESAKLMRKMLGKLGEGCSIVVTGDFNTAEGSPPYEAFFGKSDSAVTLIDAYRKVHPERKKDEGTFNAFRPDAINGPRIDWIGCSPDWNPTKASIDRTTKNGRCPSDHFPVTAELSR